MGDVAPSFKADIYPLFTDVDADHMSDMGVQLREYGYMSQPGNASSVYQQLSSKNMPPAPEGPWPDNQIALFKAWMDGGYQP